MMNEREFYADIKERIIAFLPEQYATAQITLTTKVKNNDLEQTGILVRMPQETATPVIYLDAYFRQYEEGRGMEDILTEIAGIRDRAVPESISALGADFLSDYENVRPLLQMRIYDTEKNEKRLSRIVHHSFGDYSCAYSVLLSSGNGEHSMSAMVTPELMETWGITKKKLHEDTVLADLERGPCLIPMSNMMFDFMGTGESVNLFDGDHIPLKEGPVEEETLFILTNKEKVNGAGLILNQTVQEKIADIVGGNYYVLPSSIHEVLIMPDVHDRGLAGAVQLTQMVRSINETTVAPEDVLSDRVEYYDGESRRLVNALAYEREHERDAVPQRAKAI